MGRDLFGHQQLVRGGRARRRIACIAIALAVAGAVLALFAANRVRGREEYAGAMDEAVVQGRIQEFEQLAATQSDVGSFLDDLAGMSTGARVNEGSADARAVILREDRDLPSLAGDIMRAYEQVDACSFMCGGYLDLKGNKWGSVFLCSGTWVDIVYVTALEDGAESTARIVRLSPEEAP